MIDTSVYDDIMNAVGKMANSPSVGIMPFGPFDPFGINKFYGVPVIEHPVNIKQKIKIRDDFKHCAPEFRTKSNAWLLEMFGTADESLLSPGQVFKTQYGIVIRSDEACVLRNITLS